MDMVTRNTHAGGMQINTFKCGKLQYAFMIIFWFPSKNSFLWDMAFTFKFGKFFVAKDLLALVLWLGIQRIDI